MKVAVQSSLFNNRVLDVCCGSRMFWFNKRDPRALFLDKRLENHELTDIGNKSGVRSLVVEPDMIADFRSLPFSDCSFPIVVFDPPHLTKLGNSGWLCKKYGRLNDDWREMIAAGFSECFRVLRDQGILIFKWNETDIPLSEVLCLTSNAPLFGNQCGKHSKSHWVVFAKLGPTPKPDGG